MKRWFATVLVISSAALAQEEFGPPPMVQADTVDPRQGQVLTPPTIANQRLPDQQQPLPSRAQGTLTPAAPQPPQNENANTYQGWPNRPTQNVGTVTQPPPANPRLLRIGMSALIGAGVGTAAAIAGGFIGGEYLRPGVTSIGNIYTGGAIGFAIGAPIGVMIAHLAFKGDAPWYAPVIGDLLGVALGVGTVALAGPGAVATTFLFPLTGSILAAEVVSADDATVSPTVTVLPNGAGAIAGVQGRW